MHEEDLELTWNKNIFTSLIHIPDRITQQVEHWTINTKGSALDFQGKITDNVYALKTTLIIN